MKAKALLLRKKFFLLLLLRLNNWICTVAAALHRVQWALPNGPCEQTDNNCSPRCEPDEEIHAVRCCSDVTITGWSNDLCSDLWQESDAWGECLEMSHDRASDLCAKHGGRLCTSDEIARGCVQNTGCRFNFRLLWTSDPCEVVGGDAQTEDKATKTVTVIETIFASPVNEHEAQWVQNNNHHFDRFEADLWTTAESDYLREATPTSPLRIQGWVGALGGFFLNCWACHGHVCFSPALCCRPDPHPSCFDWIYYTWEACCDRNFSVPDNWPAQMVTSQHVFMGIEQQYQRITARRMEHLSTLALPISNTDVLELGARQGDLTHYFTDRGCNVTIVEPREYNLFQLRKKLALRHLFPDPNKVRTIAMDLEKSVPQGTWQIVVCFGLLYHLSQPLQFLVRLAPLVSGFLILETVVAARPRMVFEGTDAESMSFSGKALQLSREDIFQTLKSLFPYVYIPSTQPNHEAFQTDWTHEMNNSRAIFIASRWPLGSPTPLLQEVPKLQSRAA